MKILVTGDREWNDVEVVVNVLQRLPPDSTIVHGACRGADITCKLVAEELGFRTISYPANWELYRRAAGIIRNQQMIDCEHRSEEHIDACIAFHNNIATSRGTNDMIFRATKASIPTTLFTSTNFRTQTILGCETIASIDVK